MITGFTGELSGFMATVLRKFFPPAGVNLQTHGVAIPHRGSSLVLPSTFGGFLSDLKGHKEIFRIFGTGGIRPCFDCRNVVQFRDISGFDYLTGMSTSRCADLGMHRDDAAQWGRIDYLKRAHQDRLNRRMTAKVFADLKKLGHPL